MATIQPQLIGLINSVETCSLVLMIGFIVVFALGMFGMKLVVVQMILQVQLMFYCLATIINPPLSFLGFKEMRFIGGFYVQTNNLPQQVIPSTYSNIGLFSNFISNFNLMIASIVIPFIAAGILYWISKYTKTLINNKKIQNISKQCIYEGLLSFVLINFTKVTISLIINLQFPKFQSGYIVFGFIVILLLMSQIVFFAIFRNRFYQFNNQYYDERKCKINVYFIIAKSFICSILVAVDSLFNYGIFLILGFEITYLVYLAMVRSYLKIIHRIRQIINVCITVIVLLVICFVGQASKQNKLPESAKYFPFIIIPLLFLLLIFNGGIVIRHIFTQYIKQKTPSNKKSPLRLEDSFAPAQSPNKQIDPLVLDEIQMLQTLHKYKQYQTNKKAINLSNTVQRVIDKSQIVDQKKQYDTMRKKVQDLQMNFI